MPILSRLTKYALYATLVAPLIFYRYFFYPFVTGKVLVFRLLILVGLILASLYLFKARKIILKITPLWWGLLALVAASFIAAVSGVNFTRSFWSNFERADGVLFLIHLFVYFNLLIFVFQDKNSWRWLFRISLVTSIVLVIYGIMQYFGLFQAISTTGDRISSTLGNPAYLGSYLLINIFLAIYLLAVDKNKYWRIFYLAAGSLEAWAMFLTQTRGAILGFLGGLALLALLSIFRSSNKKTRRISIVALVVIILFISSLFIFKDAPAIHDSDLFKRISSISLTSYTVQTRLAAWESSIQAFKDRPIFGWGPENYGYAFSKYFPPEIYVDSGSRIWFDKAHSVFFEYLVTTGIVGTIIYFSILSFIFYFLFKTKKLSKLESNILISLFAGYIFANLFVFDALATYILFILLLAYINNIAVHHKEGKQISFNVVKIAGLSVFLVLFLFWSYNINYIAIKQNRKILMAEAYARESHIKQAYNFYLEALEDNNNFTRFEIGRLFAVFVRNQANQLPNYEAAPMFDRAIEEVQKSIAQDPNEIRHYYNLSQLYLNSAQYDSGRINKLINLGDKMIELAPTRAHTYYQIGEAYVRNKQYNKAIEVFQTAVDLNPNITDTYHNVYAVAILMDNKELAEKTKQKMIEIDPYYFETEANLLNFLILHRRMDNKQEVISSLEKLIKLNPAKTEYYSSLAIYYAEKRENNKAIEVISRLRGRDPELDVQVNEFIRKIKAGEFVKE